MVSATRAAAGVASRQRGRKEHGISPESVPRYISKTRMCSFYLSGSCARGGACTFAHGKHELKEKPDFSCTQLCARGASCTDASCGFAHDASELRVLAPEDLSTVTKSQARSSHKRSPTVPKPEVTPHRKPPLPVWLQDSTPCARGQLSRKELAAHDFVLTMKVMTADLLSFESAWEESTWDGSQSSKSDEFEPCHVQLPLLVWGL
jgi:hypothetical protein